LVRLDLPLAHRDDAGAMIDAVIAEQDVNYHLTRLDFSGGSLWVSRIAREIGAAVRVRVLARDVSIATHKPQHSSISNILTARIIEIQDEGHGQVSLRMEISNAQSLLSRITRRSCDQLGLAVGMQVYAQVKSVVLAA
jgi:molybdate transport system ATP-binding protein